MESLLCEYIYFRQLIDTNGEVLGSSATQGPMSQRWFLATDAQRTCVICWSRCKSN